MQRCLASNRMLCQVYAMSLEECLKGKVLGEIGSNQLHFLPSPPMPFRRINADKSRKDDD